MCRAFICYTSTNGASAARILRTARKMQCFVALVFKPSSDPISLIDMPSTCRSMNAVRSMAVRHDIV